MLPIIIKLVFEKVKDSEHAASKNAISNYLSDKFENEYKIIFTPRTYQRYYDKYVLNVKNDAGKPSSQLIKAFCEYLGYKNYEDFVQKNSFNTIKKVSVGFESNNLEKGSNELEKGKEKRRKLGLVKILSVLGIIALLLYIIGAFTDIFNFNTNQDQSVVINIENFNANKTYYYVSEDGKIAFIDDINAKTLSNKTPLPVTRKVLDSYFYQQGADTTSVDYKIVKANYFSKGNMLPIIDTDNQELPTPNLLKEDKVLSNQKKQGNKSIKTLNFALYNNDRIDTYIQNTIFKKYSGTYRINFEPDIVSLYTCAGKTNYTYRKSNRTQGRIICDLTLDYQIIDTQTNEVIETFFKTTIGTGFSEETARENAIKKLQMIL